MFLAIDASHAIKEKRTGVEKTCWQIIENLKKVVPADVHVILYAHKMPIDDLMVVPPNWEWKILSWPFKKFWTQGALAVELMKNKPDVFFSPGQLLPWYVPKKAVVFLHDSAFLFFKGAYSFWGRKYLRLMNWWIVKKASTIITSTEFNRSELVRYYGAAVASKVKIAPLAYDQEKYHSAVLPFTPEELKNKFNITKPFAAFIGRLEEKKNVWRLVQAFGRARTHNDFQLVLCGRPGYGFSALEKEIAISRFKSDVIIPGWVSEEDLPRLLRSAAIFVFPSGYEGFGLPILEAMACQVPVLASDIPALREVGGEAAFFVDPHNSEAIGIAMNHILTDVQTSQRLVEKGNRRILDFFWLKTAETIAKILLF